MKRRNTAKKRARTGLFFFRNNALSDNCNSDDALLVSDEHCVNLGENSEELWCLNDFEHSVVDESNSPSGIVKYTPTCRQRIHFFLLGASAKVKRASHTFSTHIRNKREYHKAAKGYGCLPRKRAQQDYDSDDEMSVEILRM